MFEIIWDFLVVLKEFVVFFDIDYDYVLEFVLCGYFEWNIFFCVSFWRVFDLFIDGGEKELFREDGNYYFRCFVILDFVVYVIKIGVEILGLNGDENVFGGIFEVCVYE